MQLDRDRFAKLLGMLGSDHNGEVIAAARAAEKLRRETGLGWLEILTAADGVVEQAARILFAENEQLRARLAELETGPRRLPFAEPDDLDEAIELCLLWRHRLSDWEQGFLASIGTRHRLSFKQEMVVWRIVEKIGRLTRTGAA